MSNEKPPMSAEQKEMLRAMLLEDIEMQKDVVRRCEELSEVGAGAKEWIEQSRNGLAEAERLLRELEAR